jgi:hypothetical protein
MQVHKKLGIGGSIDGAVAGEVYETGVANEAGFVDAEAAKAFFQRLDQQLNKVNRFYERKEGEFLERGESLRRQLQILVELKAAITQQQQARRSGGSSKGSADTDDLSISCSIQLGENSCISLNQYMPIKPHDERILPLASLDRKEYYKWQYWWASGRT